MEKKQDDAKKLERTKVHGDESGSVTGSVTVGGKILGKGDQNYVNTGGGAYVGGDISVGGGDFVGRDIIIRGDEVHGDKVSGDKISVGDITGSAIAIGRGAQTVITAGISAEDLDSLFAPLMQAVKTAHPDLQAQALQFARDLREETAKGDKADDTNMAKLINRLVRFVPETISVVVSLFSSPVLAGSIGPLTRFALDINQEM